MAEVEFLDPGPDQPYGPAEVSAVPRRLLNRETVGLLVMLVAAAVLPLLAAFQTVYTAQQSGSGQQFAYEVDAWGQYSLPGGQNLGTSAHGPRFGLVLTVCGAAFGVLALALAAAIVRHRSAPARSIGAVVAGVAAALAGLLAGVTASMALEIETVFDNLRNSAGDPFATAASFRLRIGAAMYLSVAGLLAGGLAITAALRVRRQPDAAGDTYPTR